MPTCSTCHKELKVTFICPYCRKPFCGDHRKPEDHNCPEYNDLEFQEESKNILESDKYHALGDEETKLMHTSSDFPKTNEYLTEDDRIHDNWDFMQEEQPILKNGELFEAESEIVDEPKDKANTIKAAYKEREDLVENQNMHSNELIQKLGELKTPLTIIIFTSLIIGALIGLNLEPHNELINLQQRYEALFTYYSELEEAHNILEARNNETEMENIRLENESMILLEIYNDVNKELDEILNYKKSIQLEENKTIIIHPRNNYTLTYEIPFNGYIILNYTSSNDTFVWIGSDSLYKTYYARIPDFPNSTTMDVIIVPVQPDLKILFINDDESYSLEINIWLTFIY